jgi:hypothetical protein
MTFLHHKKPNHKKNILFHFSNASILWKDFFFCRFATPSHWQSVSLRLQFKCSILVEWRTQILIQRLILTLFLATYDGDDDDDDDDDGDGDADDDESNFPSFKSAAGAEVLVVGELFGYVCWAGVEVDVLVLAADERSVLLAAVLVGARSPYGGSGERAGRESGELGGVVGALVFLDARDKVVELVFAVGVKEARAFALAGRARLEAVACRSPWALLLVAGGEWKVFALVAERAVLVALLAAASVRLVGRAIVSIVAVPPRVERAHRVLFVLRVVLGAVPAVGRHARLRAAGAGLAHIVGRRNVARARAISVARQRRRAPARLQIAPHAVAAIHLRIALGHIGSAGCAHQLQLGGRRRLIGRAHRQRPRRRRATIVRRIAKAIRL